MEKRAAPRRKKRMTCELRFDNEKTGGIVLDLSEQGLFVQTAAKPRVNSVIDVQLSPGGGRPDFFLRARVVRLRRADRRLARIEGSGIGLQVLDAPPEFYALTEPSRPAHG
jgi:hypothetical protein